MTITDTNSPKGRPAVIALQDMTRQLLDAEIDGIADILETEFPEVPPSEILAEIDRQRERTSR